MWKIQRFLIDNCMFSDFCGVSDRLQLRHCEHAPTRRVGDSRLATGEPSFLVPYPVHGLDLAELWMRSNRKWLERLAASRNSPGFDLNILWHSKIWGAAD